jgi:hypothetical protein
MKLRLFLASAALVISACTTPVGSALTADNIEESLDAAMQIAKTLYQANKLSDAQATAIINAANAIYASAEASRASAAAGDKSSEAAQLRAAADALDALTASLAAKKGN